MFQSPPERSTNLTLNQDKRRRFDSYPGSITAGQAQVSTAGRFRSAGRLSPTVCPTGRRATVHEAAAAGCQAARDALKLGASFEQAESARDAAYAEALRGER